MRSAYLSILLGAALWGIIAVFVRDLFAFGFTPLQVVGIRVMTAGTVLGLVLAVIKPSLLKIRLADVKLFIGTGICSIIFFNWCYFTAIRETSAAIAVILLYTGPGFVVLLSRFFFKETLTGRTATALGMTMLGCSFVVGLLPEGGGTVSSFGILVGLGSGLGYALYSIFGKFALAKYHPLTVITHTFLVAGAAMAPFSGWWREGEAFLNGEVWMSVAGLGLLSTALAYLLYTAGLVRVEAGKASIAATVEPVVATLTGLLVFGESLDPWQVFGIAWVLGAVAMVQKKRRPSPGHSHSPAESIKG